MVAEFAVFAALAAAGTWLARRYALARALIDEPGERRSHSVATPRGGGIAIVSIVLAALGLALLGGRVPLVPGLAFAVGLVAIALVGWLDDHRPLSARLRFSVHVLASALFAAAWFAETESWQAACAALLAGVVLTNVWNFMDGIDGIAATQAACVAAALFVIVGHAWGLVALAVAAGCVGFLPFNFPRARIFMGDVGSGALGFALAVLSVVAAWHGSIEAASSIALALSAFLIDAAMTLARRVLRGERWWTPHTQHAYQVCARRWGHAPVTISYCAWTAVSVLIARHVASQSPLMTGGVIAAWYMSGAVLWFWLQRAGNDGSGRTRPQRRTEGSLS